MIYIALMGGIYIYEEKNIINNIIDTFISGWM